VILCIFLLSDAVSLYYRDIFSVTKLTKSLVCCWTLLVIMLRFLILQLGLRNILTSVMNPVLNLFDVVPVGRRRVLFY
jgi:hypothetical protein